ncbi:nucleotide-diphospho-sugar transferase [Nemania sp. NC0429]|nr:nucleotide-diphospho-sugar transferase [Nemania sp. NC0429]
MMKIPKAPSTRRVIQYLVGFLILALLVNFLLGIYNFANLFAFFRPHSGVFITQQEILDAYNTHKTGAHGVLVAEPVIPKILHQVFHNWSDPESTTVNMPSDWEAARQSCIATNPEWEYKLWTAKASRDFIAAEFPWFLDSYDGYRYPIQRVDVIRYFALRHFGGIYIDLDNGCKLNLDPILHLPAFTTFGGHGTLSNNIIGGQPNHPLFLLLSESLRWWNWNWILPYITISYASGQWYFTAMWEKYHRLLRAGGTMKGFDGNGWAPLAYISMDMRPGAPEAYLFWDQRQGGSWDNWDSPWFGWIGSHIWLVIKWVVAAIILLVLSIVGCVYCCRWWLRRRRRAKASYQKLETDDIAL